MLIEILTESSKKIIIGASVEAIIDHGSDSSGAKNRINNLSCFL